MSKLDQETIITFSPSDKTANIWTTDPVWIKKIAKLGAKVEDDSAEIDVPKDWIKVLPR